MTADRTPHDTIEVPTVDVLPGGRGHPGRSSLRERSKARRREAIERAAMHLFATQGYEQTTISQIAEAAELAPRTVSLHFPTKLDLALWSVNQRADRLAAALDGAGAGDPVVEVFGRWLLHERRLISPELRALSAAVFAANPELRAVRTPSTDGAARSGLAAISRELALPEDHHAVRLAHATAIGVLHEYEALVADEDGADAVHAAALSALSAVLAALQTTSTTQHPDAAPGGTTTEMTRTP